MGESREISTKSLGKVGKYYKTSEKKDGKSWDQLKTYVPCKFFRRLSDFSLRFSAFPKDFPEDIHLSWRFFGFFRSFFLTFSDFSGRFSEIYNNKTTFHLHFGCLIDRRLVVSFSNKFKFSSWWKYNFNFQMNWKFHRKLCQYVLKLCTLGYILSI